MADRGNKVPVAVRLTPTARDLIVDLAARMGLSQAGVLELAVRRLAAAEGVPERPTDEKEAEE